MRPGDVAERDHGELQLDRRGQGRARQVALHQGAVEAGPRQPHGGIQCGSVERIQCRRGGRDLGIRVGKGGEFAAPDVDRLGGDREGRVEPASAVRQVVEDGSREETAQTGRLREVRPHGG